MPVTLRTMFMGTPDIAVPALECLHRRTAIQVVITQPDRPAGRGNVLTPPPVKAAAAALDLPVWQPETLKGQAQDPRFDGIDLAIVMAYGELLRQDALDRPRLGCFNLHASLLPRWRGASPLQAVLRAGDANTGVTVMRMVRGLDAGPMALQDIVPLTPDTTLPELHDALALSAARALDRFLDAVLGDGIPALTDQDPTQVTTCHKLDASHGRLDLSQSCAAVERWVRAYTPAPGCWISLPAAIAAEAGGDRLKILAVRPTPATQADPAGTLRFAGHGLTVACGDGALELLRIQAPGRKAMDGAAFRNGSRWVVDGLRVGDV
jgi:methionyl-tRNA formyltransferase